MRTILLSLLLVSCASPPTVAARVEPSPPERASAPKAPPAAQPPTIARCTDAGDDATRKVGFTCLTVAGKSIEWVDDPTFGHAWRTPDGVVWTKDLGAHDLAAARALCTTKGGVLPQFMDLDRNDQGGLHELFADLPKEHNRSNPPHAYWIWNEGGTKHWSLFPIGAKRCEASDDACQREQHHVHCIKREKSSLARCVADEARPVGYRCATEGGSVFVRVERTGFGAAWKGPDGLVWSAVLAQESATWDEAKALCGKLGARLPTIAEFDLGNADGVYDVLGAFAGTRKAFQETLWSSTRLKEDLVYCGRYGAAPIAYNDPSSKQGVVCVER